jgi:hypothetical protein
MVWIFFVATLFFFAACVLLSAALFRFIRVIIVLEDNLPEAIEIHEQTSKTLEELSKIPYMTENKAAAEQLQAALDDVKICSVATGKLVTVLTKWSKQRYVRITEES